jgi:hypothetical protein
VAAVQHGLGGALRRSDGGRRYRSQSGSEYENNAGEVLLPWTHDGLRMGADVKDRIGHGCPRVNERRATAGAFPPTTRFVLP